MNPNDLPAAARQLHLDLSHGIIVDLFAGGGGVSKGIEMALGIPPHIAINHSDNALSLHRVNHPFTTHYIADLREVCPNTATAGRPVVALHLSPDCTHFSQASGGQPRDRAIRALSWIGVRWAGQTRPGLITLENVKQIAGWTKLVAKRDKATGRVVKLDGTVAAKGERVPVTQQYLVPDPKTPGRTWRRFKALLTRMGYVVEERVMCCADHDAPTTRERLIMIARCDGLPIVWPQPARGKNATSPDRKWRGAYQCIDWSIEGRSIFNRPRPLAKATLRRIARGIAKHVLTSADPFIVPIAHYNGTDPVHSIHEPLRTITAYPKGGAFALAAPTIVKFRGDSAGRHIAEPMPTVTSGAGAKRAAGCAHALGLATAFVAQMNGGFNDVRGTPGHDVRRPLSSITGKGSQQQLVSASLLHFRRNCDGRSLREPLRTVTAGGEHHGLMTSELHNALDESWVRDRALMVARLLDEYLGDGTPKAEEGLLDSVSVWIDGQRYVIVDITLRMLVARELARAHGFPDSYVLDRGHDGRVFPKHEQTKMIGNSVPPPLIAAIYRANASHLAIRKAA